MPSVGTEMQAIISIGGELKASVQKAIKKASKEASGFEKKCAALNKSIGKIEKAAIVAGAAMATAFAGAATVAAKKLYDLGSEFQQVENTIRIGTGATGEQLKKLEQSFDNVYKSTDAGKDTIAAAIADINTLTGAEGKALEDFALRAVDAASMLEVDAKGLYTSAAQSFNAFGISAEEMADKLDYVWKASQSTGTGMQELMETVQKNQTTFRSLGYTYEQSIALVGQMDKAGFEATDAMSALQKAVANMAKDGVKDMGKGLQNAINKIKNAKTESEAAALALEAFGARGGAKMAKGIRDGTIAVDELVKSLQASPETISAADDAADTLGDKWEEFKHNIEVGLRPAADTFYNSIKQFMPVLDRLAQQALPYVQEKATVLAMYIQKAADAFKAWAQSLNTEEIKAKINEIITTCKEWVKWIIENRDTLAEVAKNIALVYAGFKIIQTGIAIWKGVTKAITAVKAAYKFLTAEQTKQKIAQISGTVASSAATVATWAQTAATWALNGAIAVLTSPITLVIAAVAALVAGIWLLWKNWDSICAWMNEKWQAFANRFPETAAFLTNAWNTICGALKERWDAFVALLSAAWEGIKLAWSALCDLFTGNWSGFCDKIGQAFRTVWDGIKTYVKGVLDSIMSFIQPIIDKVRAIGDILGGLKDKAAGALEGIKNSKINPANWFAAGGFTNGVSICGEAGTEAVISFDPAYRKENIGYWRTAGEMLGAFDKTTQTSSSHHTTVNVGGINFSPVIKTGDNVDRGTLLQQLRACMPDFVDMVKEALREEEAHRYA